MKNIAFCLITPELACALFRPPAFFTCSFACDGDDESTQCQSQHRLSLLFRSSFHQCSLIGSPRGSLRNGGTIKLKANHQRNCCMSAVFMAWSESGLVATVCFAQRCSHVLVVALSKPWDLLHGCRTNLVVKQKHVFVYLARSTMSSLHW